ncbi:MAG: hypothetical protein AAFY98_08130 [Verrucomicrobiota bacterium]
MRSDVVFLRGDSAVLQLKALGGTYESLIPYFEVPLNELVSGAGGCYYELAGSGADWRPLLVNPGGHDDRGHHFHPEEELFNEVIQSYRYRAPYFISAKGIYHFLNCVSLYFSSFLRDKAVYDYYFWNIYLPDRSDPEVRRRIRVAIQRRYPDYVLIRRGIPAIERGRVEGERSIRFRYKQPLLWSPPGAQSPIAGQQDGLGSALKRDWARIKKSDYKVVSFKDHEGEISPSELRKFYQDMYLGRPDGQPFDYSLQYYKDQIQNRSDGWYLIMKNKKIYGYWTCHVDEKLISVGHGGCDKSLEDWHEIYRILYAYLFSIGRELKIPMYLGGGANQYKENRRAKAHWLYYQVWFHHLPLNRQIIWMSLVFLYWIQRRIKRADGVRSV